MGSATYDELKGPDLDDAHWYPAPLPLPTGGEHIPLDPNAELAVGDGHTVYEAHGTLIPERVAIGFGIWTMLPIRDGRSRSLEGQGIDTRWRRFRVAV